MRVKEANEVERVYRERATSIWRALVGYSGDREIANDAVAEAFAQALRRGSELHDVERWIWTAAFRIARGTLQAERRRRDADPPSPETRGEMPEDALVVVELLRRIPPRQRAVIVLFYYADLPTRQIAQIVGATPATVRVQLSQGRRRLRALLEDNDG
jgi:RNA polymerase sigma-70 factor (ECF subfamily)